MYSALATKLLEKQNYVEKAQNFTCSNCVGLHHEECVLERVVFLRPISDMAFLTWCNFFFRHTTCLVHPRRLKCD